MLSRHLFDDEHAGGQAREAELRQSILHQNEVNTYQARLPFQGILGGHLTQLVAKNSSASYTMWRTESLTILYIILFIVVLCFANKWRQ